MRKNVYYYTYRYVQQYLLLYIKQNKNVYYLYKNIQVCLLLYIRYANLIKT